MLVLLIEQGVCDSKVVLHRHGQKENSIGVSLSHSLLLYCSAL